MIYTNKASSDSPISFINIVIGDRGKPTYGINIPTQFADNKVLSGLTYSIRAGTQIWLEKSYFVRNVIYFAEFYTNKHKSISLLPVLIILKLLISFECYYDAF